MKHAVPLSLAAFGVVFFVVASVLSWEKTAAESERRHRPRFVDEEAWSELAIGRAVALEGAIARRTHAAFGDFVAFDRYAFTGYRTYEERGQGGRTRREEQWRQVAHERPTLIVERSGRTITVRGAYALDGVLARIDDGTRRSASGDRPASIRTSGLRLTDDVVVIGRVVASRTSLEPGRAIHARTVFRGTRAMFEDAERESVRVAQLLSYIFGAVGVLLIAIAGVVARFARHRRV